MREDLSLRVGIVGLGLIGGSMAKAFHEYTNCTVTGFDSDPAVLEAAAACGAIDAAGAPDDLSRLDLLILAIYPQAAVDFVRENGARIPRSCLVRRLFHSLALYLRDTGRYTDADPRFPECFSSHRFLNEIFQHFFCDQKVCDHSLAQGADRHDVARRTPDHLSCFLSDCLDFIGVFIICNYGRLFEHDSFSFGIHQNTGGSKVDSYICPCSHIIPLSSPCECPQTFCCCSLSKYL